MEVISLVAINNTDINIAPAVTCIATPDSSHVIPTEQNTLATSDRVHLAHKSLVVDLIVFQIIHILVNHHQTLETATGSASSKTLTHLTHHIREPKNGTPFNISSHQQRRLENQQNLLTDVNDVMPMRIISLKRNDQ
jgi:hypothetical protein